MIIGWGWGQTHGSVRFIKVGVDKQRSHRVEIWGLAVLSRDGRLSPSLQIVTKQTTSTSGFQKAPNMQDVSGDY